MALTHAEARAISRRYDTGFDEAWEGPEFPDEPYGYWWLDVIETLYPDEDEETAELYDAARASESTAASRLGLPVGTPSAELRAALEAQEEEDA